MTETMDFLDYGSPERVPGTQVEGGWSPYVVGPSLEVAFRETMIREGAFSCNLLTSAIRHPFLALCNSKRYHLFRGEQYLQLG